VLSRSRLLAIFTAVFSSYVAAGLVLPLTPVTLIDRLGEGESSVGVSLFALAVGGLAGRFAGGAVVDGKGVRAGFQLGLICTALGACGYSFVVHPWLFIGGRAVLGFGESLVYIAASTALIDMVPQHRRSRFIGLLGSAVWGGISVGPVIGERLDRIEPAGWITIGSACGSFLLARSAFRNPSFVGRRFSIRVPRAALLPGTVIGLYNLGYAAITGFVILHMRTAGFESGWALSTYGLAVLFGRLALGGIPDRLGPAPSVTVGVSTMAAALCMIAIAPSRAAVLVSLAVFGLGYSMPFPAIASMTVNRVAHDERASALAVLGGSYDVFAGCAGLLFGVLAESHWGTTSVFVSAILGTIWALIIGRVVTADRTRSRSGPTQSLAGAKS
jgi:MFS family permease